MVDEALNQESETKPNYSLLASQRYGNNYKGEVSDSEQESVQDEPPPEDGEDTQDPPPDDEPVVAEDTEEDPGPEDDDPKPEEEPGKEYELSEVAQILGVDESALDVDEEGRVVLNKKVDGQTTKTKIDDLLKIGQTWEAAEKRLEDAKAKAKAINQEMSEKTESIQEQYAVAASLIESIEKSMADDSSSIDWKSLREDDPAEYSAKKLEIEEKQGKLEKMKQEAVDKYNKAREAIAAQSETAQKEHLAKEHEALITKIPEWKDEETAKVDKSHIADYLLNQGFEKEDIANAADHRLIVMARKAMLYDQDKTKNNALSKKVKVVPKVLKPGTTKPAEQATKDKIQRQREKLRRSGSKEDAWKLMQMKKA